MMYTKEENRRWHNSLPKKPSAAHVLLWDDQSRLLIGKPNYRDHWNLPGGVVDPGESPLEAAIREAQEEFDITVDRAAIELKLVHYTPEDDGFHDFVTFIFDGGTLTASQVGAIKLQESEMDDYRFVAIDEAKRLLGNLRAGSLDAIFAAKPPLFISGT